METPRIVTFGTAREAAEACGVRTFELLEAARLQRGVANIAVSGGSTPRVMFEWMAKSGFDWSNVQIYQVDERCFPPDHEQSNYRMLRESLLAPASIPDAQVHRMKGEIQPAEAARLYAVDLPVFDVIQRGMGPDAHTASLFPGEPLIADQTGVTAAVWVEKMQQHRVTLLRGVLEKARATLCLVSGADKAGALHNVLEEPFDPMKYPCQIASPATTWFIDQAAAAKLTRAAG